MKRSLLLLTTLLVVALQSISATDKPRYIFYLIGDGMGLGHTIAANYYNCTVRGATEPLLMMQFPHVGLVTTYSQSDIITDSSAAGTALSTGHKTANGIVGLAPDSITPLQSIASYLKGEGWGVGILSSLSLDDATPAAFYAHQKKRGMYYEIACDGAASGYDFLGGANIKGMRDKKENILRKLYRKNGYTILTDPLAPIPADASKVLFLSPQGHSDIGYTLDSITGAVKLADMSRMALAHLSKQSPKHFFLMIEGGNIDHAAHANDAGTTIKEIVAFQDAIRVAYDFYLAHPRETLIVVTSDHDTGGLAISGHRVDLSVIDSQRMSKDTFSDYCKKLAKSGEDISWSEMKSFLTEKFGLYKSVRVNAEQNKLLKEAFEKTYVSRQSNDEKGLYNTFNEFVIAVFDVLNYRAGVGFVNRSHTANPVAVYAIGCGAELFNGVMDNTDIPSRIHSLTH